MDIEKSYSDFSLWCELLRDAETLQISLFQVWPEMVLMLYEYNNSIPRLVMDCFA